MIGEKLQQESSQAHTRRPSSVCGTPKRQKAKQATFPVVRKRGGRARRALLHDGESHYFTFCEAKNVSAAMPLFHSPKGSAPSVLMFFLTQQHKRAADGRPDGWVFVMCGTRRQERCRAVAYLNTSSVCVRDKPTVCNGRFALPQGRLVVGAATGRPWKVSKCSKPHEEERNMRRKKATFPVGRTFAHLRCANGAAVPEGHAAAAPQAQGWAPPPQPEFPLPFL